MAMRLSGLMSGMDTESIVSQLVEVRQKKVDTQKKAQTKLEWKQDAWKELNTKLKNLQSKYVNSMRFSTAYAKKTTKVSDSSVASVITGENAVNGVQTLRVKELAKTGYLTGGEVQTTDGSDATALTKMSELGFSGSTTLNLAIGGDTANPKTISIDADTTISDVINQLKEKGLNANFDADNQRLFISSKTSGKDSDFEIYATSGDSNGEAALAKLGLKVGEGTDVDTTVYATKVKGADAEIYLNGAKFTSSTNVFNINGLTITANSATNQEISLTTENDTDGIYDMIKNFIKEYNSVINEIDKLYNAASAKGYEPLTDDEKETMTDSEVEKYEKKIKDALLRRDENLSTIGSALRETMSSGISVGGKTMYLFDFGISPLGYFNAADNEKNAYHIDGDSDDADTSGNADKLKSMIASDPDSVVEFFSSLSKNLYDKMNKLSTSVNGYRSFGSFYDDKKMKSDYDSYTTKIKEMEEKLNDYEDKWYKKFSKMETAMAKMQNNSNAIAGMLGGS